VLTRGRSVFTPMFLSRLEPIFSRYVNLKRALGRRFDLPARTLQSLDRFLQEHSAQYPDLNAAAFEAWCHNREMARDSEVALDGRFVGRHLG
jgi:hypothetical protein